MSDDEDDLPAALAFDDDDGRGDEPRDESSLELAAELGDADALAELLSKQPGRLGEALDLLRRLVAMEPWRTRSLQRLNELAVELGIGDVQAVTDQLISTFDTTVPYRSHGPVAADAFWTEDLHGLIDSALSEPMRELLAILWRAAARTEQYAARLDASGACARHEVRTGSGPVARCVQETSALLGVEGLRVYLKPSRDPEIQLVAAQQPSIVATTGISGDECLRFYVARCVMRARPELVVLTALPPEQARQLVWGLVALGRGEQPEPLRQVLAAMEAQDLLRGQELACALQSELLFEPLLAAAERDEIRGALLATGDAHLSLRGLLQIERSLQGLRPRVAMQFGEACQRSHAFAEAVRFSLSDGYLGVVDRTLQRQRQH